MRITNRKNILIVSQYFWPESFLINNFETRLTKYANIIVLTGLPNYPDGEIKKKYKNIKNLYYEKWKNIQIIRFPIIPRKKGGAIFLSINYLSFLINGLKYSKRISFDQKIDHILFYSTSPITSCIPAIALKSRLKAKLSIWVQDLWPESLQATGYINNKIIIKLFGILVRYIYKKSDYIFAQSKSFVKNIQKYSHKKINILYNSHLSKKSKKKIILDNKILDILKKKKCFAFAGNLGKAQSLETIVNCAKKISMLDKSIHFLIIGDGSEKKNIKKVIFKNNITNISLHGPYDASVVDEILKKTISNLITLKKHSIFSLTIPNKFQSYLLSGKPIICAIDGELKEIINTNKLGEAASAEDYSSLSEIVIRYSKLSKSELNKFKKKNIQFYNKNFEIDKQVKLFLKTVKCIKK